MRLRQRLIQGLALAGLLLGAQLDHLLVVLRFILQEVEAAVLNCSLTCVNFHRLFFLLVLRAHCPIVDLNGISQTHTHTEEELPYQVLDFKPRRQASLESRALRLIRTLWLILVLVFQLINEELFLQPKDHAVKHLEHQLLSEILLVQIELDAQASLDLHDQLGDSDVRILVLEEDILQDLDYGHDLDDRETLQLLNVKLARVE